MIGIKRVIIEITKKCNLSCKHCYVNGTKRELTLEEIKKFLDYLKEKDISNITFTGGEPFVRKDFFDILNYASKKGFKITIFTNGTLISERVIGQLKKLNVEQIQISLDGSKQEIHDKIRGKGTFNKTINTIRLLLKNNFKIVIMTTIMNENIDDVINVSKLCAKLGCRNWCLHPTIASGKGKNLEKINLSKYLKIMETFGGAVQAPCNTTACGIGFNKIAILSDGSIVPCEVIQDLVLGNIKKDDLLKCFYESEIMKEIRNSTIENIPKCKDCLVKYECRGGCKAAVWYEKRTFSAPDITNCISHRLEL